MSFPTRILIVIGFIGVATAFYWLFATLAMSIIKKRQREKDRLYELENRVRQLENEHAS
ncbi:MAG: hypothetical protein AAGH99_09070 [Planctomycetota bacterium]